ncbi:MAG TPA: HlyD family efflux transporter periplasmic adaptor subunit [Candidatus Acidoferrum sp.]|nr:HlyD family efflux transporter periplasmic adaptor subunit [Candidatus Acidoferrum sp.]
MTALFREAAIARRQHRLEGALILSQPLPLRWLVMLLATTSAAALLWLAQGHYQRKVTVAGTLEPDAGLVELPAPQNGILAQLLVVSGQQVAAGQPLFVLESTHVLESGQLAEAGSLAALQRQATQLQRQVEIERLQQIDWQRHHDERLRSADAVIGQWRQTLARQQQLLELRQKQADRGAALAARKLLAEADHEALAAQLLLQQQTLADAGVQLESALAARQQLLGDHAAQLWRSRQQIEQWSAQLQQNQQQQLQQESEYRRVVAAPVAGYVSALAVKQGMAVRAQQTVLELVPAAASLQVELHVPSQAMGFVRAGQQMTLRFDAFPYQKFGVQRATLSAIAGSSEQPERAGPDGGQPYYRLVAELDKQTVTAYGNEVPLRPGMRLTADIGIDSRSLLEWLLEPLYSLKGH